MSPYADEDHELWPGLVESIPEQFAAQAAEPAFSDDEDGFLVATVCLWRLHDDPAAVKDVFEHRPLTDDLVRRLNPHADLPSLTETLDTIGYPTAGESA